MKKFILIAAAALMTLAFVSCGAKGTCEVCGTTDVSLTKVTFQGESAKLCDTCKALFDIGKKMME